MAKSGQRVNCERCGVPLTIGVGAPEARFITLASGPRGLCANCVVTRFFKSQEMAHAADCGKARLPEALRSPHVQAQFACVLRAGESDLAPDLIDWLEVIANWHLPFPGRGKSKGAGGSLWS